MALCPGLLDQFDRHSFVDVVSYKPLPSLNGPSIESERESGGLEGDLVNVTPWAIELKSDNRCVFATGATWIVSETRLNFICDDGFAFGMPEMSGATWTIIWTESEPLDSHRLVRVPIRRAWL